jgi:hypothetical protein
MSGEEESLRRGLWIARSQLAILRSIAAENRGNDSFRSVQQTRNVFDRVYDISDHGVKTINQRLSIDE